MHIKFVCMIWRHARASHNVINIAIGAASAQTHGHVPLAVCCKGAQTCKGALVDILKDMIHCIHFVHSASTASIQ